MNEQRLAELEELAKAGKLTTAEQRELDELRAELTVSALKLTEVTQVVTGLKLTDTRTGEVTEWPNP